MFIAERWIDSVIDVVRKHIINSVSAYAAHVGLSAEEKDNFWGSYFIMLSGIPKQDSIFIDNDLNGHIGIHDDGYGGVHGGKGFGTRNAEGGRILEFGDAVVMRCATYSSRRKTLS